MPAREDLATPESWSSPISTRTAIEAMPEGCIAVVDAMGVTDAGIFGDILCARMVKRGVAALITDGVVRDLEGVLGTGLPVWCDGFAAPPSVAGLTFVGWGEPIGCGGVAVFPNDIIVADQDGAVLIPQALLDHVLAEGAGAGADGSLDRQRGEQRRGVARPLSDERRDQGALRGHQEITQQREVTPWTSISPARGRPAGRRRTISPARCWQDPIIQTEAPARLASTRVSFEPGRAHRLAHPSARPDALCDLRRRPGAGQGRTDPRNPARRRRLDSAGREALAWRVADQRA